MELRYDPEVDSAYLKVSKHKAYETLEINQNILVDITSAGRIVGIELLDTSQFLSSILAHKVDKQTIKDALSVRVRQESKRELILNISYEKEHVIYAIPKAYSSPLLQAAHAQ